MSYYTTDTLTSPYLVIDNFLPDDVALAMRSAIDEHFANPNKHSPEIHQIWNYWFVPGMYTYMRTLPDKIMPHAMVEQFHGRLQEWSLATLGMRSDYWPFLSLYVNNCEQAMHNDSKNGRFAYVYSLTRNDRKTSGGQTIVFHEGDLFRDNVRRAQAGTGFFDQIEPVFNRLVIFDDRIPHAVKRVEGSMDPLEGRFVFHGHIEEVGMLVTGVLTPEVVGSIINPRVEELTQRNEQSKIPYHGPLVVRLHITSAGEVATLEVLVDRVIGISADMLEWHEQREHFGAELKRIAFPPSSGETIVTVPVMMGGTLR